MSDNNFISFFSFDNLAAMRHNTCICGWSFILSFHIISCLPVYIHAESLPWFIVGVQDMACDMSMKITKKCARQFVVRQSEEKKPFVEEILRNIGRITVDLLPQQVRCVLVLWEA